MEGLLHKSTLWIIVSAQARIQSNNNLNFYSHPMLMPARQLIIYELQRRNRINSTPVHGSNTAYGPIPMASSPVKLEGHNNHNVCSSDNSTQLCDALAGGLNKPDVINTQPFDWTTHYGVYRILIQQHIFTEFNKEIWDHFTKNLQNDDTFAWKMRIRKDLNDILHEINEECSLIPVGSTIDGCGSYNCDMDLCLQLPIPIKKKGQEKRYILNTLKQFKKRLGSLSVVKRVKCISLQIPQIKVWFNQAYEQLGIMISVNNNSAIFNSYLIHHYSRANDKFPALCLLIKHWANRQGINEPADGTFNSYSLILLVLHFLQVGCDPPVLPTSRSCIQTFLDDLDLQQLNIFGSLPTPCQMLLVTTNLLAISISKGKAVDRCELEKSNSKVFIEDPMQPELNTAQTVVGNQQWQSIKQAFAEARDAFLHAEAMPPNLLALKISRVF
uniref:Poly(A) RNA polymerase mitochondrial-like central palm domain-containing protein n=1 Tax=Ditylenchus dipsaci TaxID=166011 RepID=A0A915E4I9_9BILA